MDEPTTIALALDKPNTLDDVRTWAACAAALGIADVSNVQLSMSGVLTVRVDVGDVHPTRKA